MSRASDGILAAVLAAFCCSTAVAVVYTTHLSRQAYAEIGRSRQALDDIQVQLSRLQIEESTFSGHDRIERTARESLGMRLPGLEESIMIERQANP